MNLQFSVIIKSNLLLITRVMKKGIDYLMNMNWISKRKTPSQVIRTIISNRESRLTIDDLIKAFASQSFSGSTLYVSTEALFQEIDDYH